MRSSPKMDKRPPRASRRHIDIVLVEPQKPENIGAVARAMINMGLGRLILVRPRTINWDLIRANATIHAERVLESMTIHQNLPEAIAAHGLVVGTTARMGRQRGVFFTPRQIAPELISGPDPEDGDPVPVSIMFGPERMGLSTSDLRLCQKVICIPTDDPASSSLNLGQAVLILGYELLMAAGIEPDPPKIKPASQEDLLGMYKTISDTLVGINFLPADNPDHWMMNLKKIFNRSQLTAGECSLWRGVCRQINWAVENSGLIMRRREEAEMKEE